MTPSFPLVSVLISTYNRSALLARAIKSVLKQSLPDFELVIIDDNSSDNTAEVIQSFQDARIRYIKNPCNVGAAEGDRAHIRRFVYELMQGSYFVYLCDDDYWLSDTLLERQVAAFRQHEDVVMVIGGQLSHFIPSESHLSLLDIDKVPKIAYKGLRAAPIPPTHFMAQLFDKPFMTAEEYLTAFSADPATRNIIVGATLYSKKHFMESGALLSERGSQWQAGYELLVGPACYGNVVYIDEPAIVVEVRASNASFRRTQVEHYLDCMESIEAAFFKPIETGVCKLPVKKLEAIKKRLIKHISHSFLKNTIVIKTCGKLTACSDENIGKAVYPMLVYRKYWANNITLTRKDLYFLVLYLPSNLISKLFKLKLLLKTCKSRMRAMEV